MPAVAVPRCMLWSLNHPRVWLLAVDRYVRPTERSGEPGRANPAVGLHQPFGEHLFLLGVACIAPTGGSKQRLRSAGRDRMGLISVVVPIVVHMNKVPRCVSPAVTKYCRPGAFMYSVGRRSSAVDAPTIHAPLSCCRRCSPVG